VTYYNEWVLGAARPATASFVTTTIDEQTRAMFARNPWRTQFGEQRAFADMRGQQTSWTGDRREFLGPFGRLAAPRALSLAALSNRTGAGLDPCCALQTVVTIEPGGSTELVVMLGAAPNAGEAQALITRYRTNSIDEVLGDVKRYWTETLGAVQVKTPDRAFDVMLNGWLLYQTLACRMWARSGFYQTSGAYGFRDQLQDSMALLITRPMIAREHILRAAARHLWREISSIGGFPPPAWA
jgi:cyclic beta-1,2-glucan synthetase